MLLKILIIRIFKALLTELLNFISFLEKKGGVKNGCSSNYKRL